MRAQPNTVYRGTTPVKDDEQINFREIFREYSFHWPLFILFLLVTMFSAYVYYKVKKPAYDVMATLEIPDQTKDNKANPDKEPLDQIDLANPTKIVENEIEVLRSINLITKVVGDLQLWANYSRKSKLVANENLYKRSPVQFRLLKLKGYLAAEKFEVVIRDHNTFLLKRSDGKFAQFHFGDVLSNDFGSWQLVPTPDLDKFIGQTITIGVTDPSVVVTAYQSGLKIDLVDKQASTLTLSITDEDAQRGKDFLNDLISKYNQAEVEQKNNITQSTLDFIDKRLATLSGELSRAEGQVQQFQSSRGVTDLDRQSQAYLENVQQNDKDLGQVNIQLNVVNEIEQYINSPGSTNVPSTLGISDAGLSALVDKLSELNIERARMAATMPETNPQFDPINRQIQATRSAIAEKVRNAKNQLLAQKRELQSYSNKFQASIRNVPVQQKDFIGLKRNQTLKDDLYTYLLKKREEIALSYASVLSNARTVDSAYVLPVKPLKKYAPFGVAIAMSFLLPIGLIYGRNSIKNAVTTSKEITSETNLPILCELSYESTNTPIVVHDRGKFAIAEEFRTLRTKLHYLHGKTDHGRVTLITSSISSEGKSFIATNLAVAIAASGRKTVILEMDLRKPRVSPIFDLGEHSGISNYLNGEVNETSIIQHSATYPNLDIIGSGDYYQNPSELLEQSRLETLIAWLRERYDDVIIDTPPVNVVTDAIVVARTADVTLYTIRQGYTSKALLPFISNLNDEQHFPKLNVLFNGIEKGRYGYSGYGYGYGDYITDKNTKRKYSNSIFRDFSKRF